MERITYTIILSYFILGGIGFYIINRKRDREIARQSYTKFIVYFFIINILFFSIVIQPLIFRYLSVLIIAAGFFELYKLFREDHFTQKAFFIKSTLIFTFLSAGLFLFSGLNKELILFSFLVLSIFDSFSQISGQLFGRTKLLPNISPNKTLGGLLGGASVALVSALLLSELYNPPLSELLTMVAGIVVFAFVGDAAASGYKRKYNVKDYSKIIPGHGGFLDRFDSLIAGGAWVAFSVYVLGF